MMEGCSASSSTKPNHDSHGEKWACAACTYLNYTNNIKCTICLTSRSGLQLRIEEVAAVSCPPATPEPRGTSIVDASQAEKWSCPTCTYSNFLRTKHCAQCDTGRPLRYDEGHVRTGVVASTEESTESTEAIADALNKWACSRCTYRNWPNAQRCAMCGHGGYPSPMEAAQVQQDKRIAQELAGRISRLNVHPSPPAQSPTLQRRAEKQQMTYLTTYLNETGGSRKYAGNDSSEKLYFRAITSISDREIEAVNCMVDYLIGEGNLRRSLSGFETRVLNGVYNAENPFERGDRLIDVAKKNNCGEMIKLIKRVSMEDDRLPCAVNSDARAHLYAKVAQLSIVRSRGPFTGQLFPHPHSFNILKFPTRVTGLSLEVMRSMVKPTPSIPPSWVFADCIDMSGDGSRVVGRPTSFLMRNRYAAHSLCDSISQAMYGVCDRFNIVRTALNFTMLNNAELFKSRWTNDYVGMARDCGLSLNEEDLENDWEETLSPAREEDEDLEPIHIFALAHVAGRPIVVISIDDDPLELSELGNLEFREARTKPKFNDMHEGVYLPVLWGSAPTTRSPIILAHKNGLYHAVIVNDVAYPRESEVQRLVRLRRPRYEHLFRFLLPTEVADPNFLAQLVGLGMCTNDVITIHRDPHTFFPESLDCYASWLGAVQRCHCEESNREPVRTSQLERVIPQLEEGYEEKLIHLLSPRAAHALSHPASRLRGRAPIPHDSRPYSLTHPLVGQIEIEEPVQSEDEEEDDD